MENISHSRKPNRGSSQATLTKRTTTTCNGAATNFPGKTTMYDDVFGGPPRFATVVGPNLSPRPEDYTEIFGGFHVSRDASIPVMDLPSVDDNDEVMFEARNPRFSYADVFGGFDGLDFASPYEELMRQANGADDHDRDGDSSEETWMQAETKSLSEGSDHSGDCQYFLNGDYFYEPIDSSMEFDISYHEANLRSNSDMLNGVTHVPELHSDPENAYIIETPLQKTENKYPPLHVADDINLEFTGGVKKKKHLRKTVSHPSNWTADEHTFRNDSTQREYRRNGSCSRDIFVAISEINLRTLPSDVPPPSRPPPLVDVENGDYRNGLQAASGGRIGDNSPPFFDVEIDASLAAAATMKEAIYQAQAKLKSAKELLERKRESVKNSTKAGLKFDGSVKKESSSKIVHRSSDIKGETVQRMYGKEDSEMKILVKEERQKAVKFKAPDSLEGDKHFNVPKKFVVEKLGKESEMIQESDAIDGADEWQEARQFFELVRMDKSTTGFKLTKNEKYSVQHMKSDELQQKAKTASTGPLELQLDSDEIAEAVREDHEPEKVEGVMKTTKEKHEFRQIMEHKEEEKQEKETSKTIEDPEPVDFKEKEGEVKSQTDVFELEKNKTKLEQVLVQSENEMRLREAPEQEEKEKRLKEGSVLEENGTKEDALGLEEGENIWRMALEQLENEKKQKQACFPDGNERRQRKAFEFEELEKKQSDAIKKDENKRRTKLDTEQEKDGRLQEEVTEKEETKNGLKEACEKEAFDRRLKEVCEKEGTTKRLREAHDKSKVAKMLEEAVEKNDYSKVVKQEENEELQGVNYVYQQIGSHDNGKKCPEIFVEKNDQNNDELEEIQWSILEENGKVEADFRDTEKKLETMGGDVDGNLNASGMTPFDLEVKVTQFIKNDASFVKIASEAGIGIGQRNAKKIYSVAGMDSYEWREGAGNIKDAQVPQHLEENKDKFVSAQAVEESIKTGWKPDEANASVFEGKGRIQKTVQQVKISESTERRDKNMMESLTSEDKEAERLKREREMEKEHLRKIEEEREGEREREREREKDRLAVDRAALEAGQRAMEEAHDGLERAFAEAKEKSSVEARLRSEHAAVERAAAEARIRAVEKAMAERAAFDARERVERSMLDKFSTSSRNSGISTSSSSSDLQDQHFQKASSFGGLGNPYSSAHYGVEGESPQRCKARMERYRRTAERAAKALKEMNMRDLLAQREQAERNRIAETLDADVKRWSSGKEGNLRALLSTLQYILGPESGWQPIPLTEVITSAAVKKAYRKATLCVHPDKLLQRAASIHQKYICEKVFDLLKEAWNRFNSEER